MRSEILTKLMSEIPLSTTLKVYNQTAFIDFLSEMGVRENKMWTEEEHKLLERLSSFSDNHTKLIIKVLQEHGINANEIFRI